MNRFRSRLAAAGRSLESLAGQAYMVSFMLVLAFAGVLDVTREMPYPPEIVEAAPMAVFHLFGVYMVAGAVLVVAGCGTRDRPRGRRMERAGHLMVASGAVFLACMVGLFVTSGAADCVERDVVAYLNVVLAATVAQSLCRWWWLGRKRYLTAAVPCSVGCAGVPRNG